MELNEYQTLAVKTTKYHHHDIDPQIQKKINNINYLALGLTGEAGEVANKVKKIYRDNKGLIDKKSEQAIIHELGDILWYIAAMADELGYDLNEIARINNAKLLQRQINNTINGDGDNR